MHSQTCLAQFFVVIIAANMGACAPDEGVPPVTGGTPQESPVTGDPTQGDTEDFEQAETAITIVPRGAQADVIVVGFNDRTQNPADPKIEYPAANERILHRGASLMGWSTSTDVGASFTYHSQLAPPAGWSLLYGDPFLTTSGEQVVYMSNLGGSDAKFPASGEFFSDATGPSVRTVLDGFCIARSADGGLSFPELRCFKHGTCTVGGTECANDAECAPANGVCNGMLYDGTALAADTEFVFFASMSLPAFVPTQTFDVWRASSSGLNFQRIVPPFPGMKMATHPRLQIFNRHLYILGHEANGVVFASRLDLDDPMAVWSTPQAVSRDAVVQPEVLLSDRSIRTANQFSFDIGMNPQTAMNELRVAITRRSEDNKLFIELSRCPTDLSTNCSVATGWTTGALPGDQWNPMLKVSGTPALWKLVFMSRDSAPSGNVVSVRHGNLAVLPDSTRILSTSELIEPQIPCTAQDPSDPSSGGYWGDYNELTNLRAPGDLTGPEPRFIATFTDNRAGCNFRGRFTADMHVGAAVLQ